MRRLFLTTLLLFTFGICQADVEVNHFVDDLQAFGKDCHFELGRNQVANIVSSKVGKITPSEWGDYRTFEIVLKVKLQKKLAKAILSASCYTKEKTSSDAINTSLPSLKEMIASEDGGGRYFRHVAWERKITGMNWGGRIAYLDYVFGDGQRSSIQEFIVQRVYPSEQMFNFRIDLKQKLSSQDRQEIVNLICRFQYLSSKPFVK